MYGRTPQLLNPTGSNPVLSSGLSPPGHRPWPCPHRLRKKKPRSLRSSTLTASQLGPHGQDAAKKITGRKRHVLVDTCGFPLALKMTPADVQDRDEACMLTAVLMLAFGGL
ncbi:MAG: hypothetical protein EOP86_08305 [Verrucomicrobiaceae bacterium]|nr:MAG: hypothetical protein EOP86_08305 [Verrucomicrobiaceae bacterium]